MKKTADSISRFIPTAKACFILTVILILLGCAMASTTFVVRKRVDHDGQVMLSPDGDPLLYVDQWASYWNGWPSNLPITAGVGFFTLGIVILIRRMLHKVAMSNNTKKPNKPQMATPNQPPD